MDKKIKYYISNKTKYSYPILTKDVQCSNCKNFYSIEFASNLKKIEKECPSCKTKMDIKLKD
ncbi:hypothetical protein ACL9FO_000944 [Campylobacter coli]|uniref:Uncharacterized protein n=2 Tax=Campylobacter coli TaxID=195 RepID=A0A5T1I0V1_CAMCO|nr:MULTISPECIES: hypothetical protein [Campylobacter]EAI7420917.1 hypothetical protein [Campylobacter hyointestinalis]EAK5660640.1 hypothetical protein [Campylobacter fetus]EDP0241634.1 hypothetical protein [Campylobacter jejuni]EIA54543.1 hypothetical protein cco115_06663 [Campylobacter coli 2692]EIA55878.1 hypothetical protein cco117_06809 [Campylobacter coli 2698]EIA70431.1 hypothetical protein cco4_05991 [Campylobacter coli 7--1]EIA74480.1 hypothetical protein cco54_04048 [Campylobacter 